MDFTISYQNHCLFREEKTCQPNTSVIVIKGFLVSLSIQLTNKGFLCSHNLQTIYCKWTIILCTSTSPQLFDVASATGNSQRWVLECGSHFPPNCLGISCVAFAQQPQGWSLLVIFYFAFCLFLEIYDSTSWDALHGSCKQIHIDGASHGDAAGAHAMKVSSDCPDNPPDVKFKLLPFFYLLWLSFKNTLLFSHKHLMF